MLIRRINEGKKNQKTKKLTFEEYVEEFWHRSTKIVPKSIK
jgi:uncharacterized protein YnzC (UPF0291/DUF896 family)